MAARDRRDDPFEALAESLLDAEARLEEANAPAPVLAAIQPMPAALRHAATRLRSHRATDVPLPPERVALWRHAVREKVSALVGVGAGLRDDRRCGPPGPRGRGHSAERDRADGPLRGSPALGRLHEHRVTEKSAGPVHGCR